MRTVPSDLSVNSCSDVDVRWEDNAFLRKKVVMLQKQVKELGSLLSSLTTAFRLQSVADVSSILVYVNGEEIQAAMESGDFDEVQQIAFDTCLHFAAENGLR